MPPRPAPDDAHFIKWANRLQNVPRWSVVPVIRRQSVAEHSFMVAMIARYLATHHADSGSLEFHWVVLLDAMMHDIDEAAKGDSPSPVKEHKPVDPTDQIKVVVKCADYLESLLYIKAERLMGNSFMNGQILMDVQLRLHYWWDEFQWNPANGSKPITSDLIRMVTDVCYDTTDLHPGLEK
jgi:hypothetical protein